MPETDDDKIVKQVDLNAPVARVWQALTDYKEFGHWFRVHLDQPFEVGAESTGHITYPGHEYLPWLVFVEGMEHERLFSFRWFDTDDDTPTATPDQPGLLVEFRLEDRPAGTRLTITESGFSNLPDPRRTELMRDNTEGWTIQAKHIAAYLSS